MQSSQPTDSNESDCDNREESLRLSPFERYMLKDERLDRFPMSVPIHWTVSGKPQFEPFCQAFREAIGWHPMLHSLVDRDVWRIDDRAISEVGFFTDGRLPTSTDRRVDAYRGPTVRCNIVERGEETKIEFTFHHAASDGISFMEFCGDVFANYAVLLGKLDPAKIRRPQLNFLANRAKVDRTIPEPVARMTALKFTVKETVRFFIRRAEVVAADMGLDPAQRDECCGLRMVDAPLSPAQSEQVTDAVNRAEVSLNDWAILSLLRVIAKWNDDANAGSRRAWLVANIPVLLRPKQAARMSAANMIGYGFLSRRRDSIKDWDTALQALAEESRFIQRWKIAGMFLDGVSTIDRIPGGLYAATRASRVATCVVSNLSDAPRRFRTKLPIDEQGHTIAGDFTILRLSGAAPLRPGTHVAALVNTVGGRINLSLQVLPELFSQQAAERLVAMWKDEMIDHS